jgi:hypothetical protein
MILSGQPAETEAYPDSEQHFQASKWLPGQMCESVVLWDTVAISGEPAAGGCMRIIVPAKMVRD